MSFDSLTSGRRGKMVLGGICTALATLVLLVLLYPWAVKKLEVDPPLITCPQELRGIGVDTEALVFEVADAMSGLSSITIHLTQFGANKLLFRKQFQEVTHTGIKLLVEQFREELGEGEASITLRAYDRSFWGNVSEKVFRLVVDRQRPALELLTDSQKAASGASHVLVYQANDANLFRSGVEISGKTYLGHPAGSVDKTLAGSDLYVAAFPVVASTPLRGVLFAEDVVGNRAAEEHLFRGEAAAGGRKDVETTERFMYNELRSLAETQLSVLQERTKIPREEYNRAFLPANQHEEVVEKFKLLHLRLRPINDEAFAPVFEKQSLGAFFKEHFVAPAGSAAAGFGDRLSYFFEGEKIGEQVSSGLFVRTAALGERVYASNDGVVAFAGTNGVYGLSLIIDHGLAVTSQYSPLRSLAAVAGAKLRRGDLVGFSGDSGLAPFPLVYFEMRVQGVPVNPAEWTDPGDFYKRFTQRIDEAKKSRGVPLEYPLDWSFKP